MNHHQITITDAESVDGTRLHRVLQQSIDHYPRLAALSFTLPESLSNGTATTQARLQRFRDDVYHHFGDYAHRRSTTGKPSPPTLLRWLWGNDNRMLLLFNLAVCYHPRHDVSPEAGLQSMASLLEAAWGAPGPAGTLSYIIPFCAERTSPGTFEKQLAVLRAAAMQIASPVMTACSRPTSMYLTSCCCPRFR